MLRVPKHRFFWRSIRQWLSSRSVILRRDALQPDARAALSRRPPGIFSMRFRLNNATTGGPECRVILLAQ